VRIPVVQGVTPEIHAMATGGSSSGLGSGGMTSKLQAAEIAEMAGMALAIIDGQPARPSPPRSMPRAAPCSCRAAATPRARPGWAGACACAAR
jgi:glutamate 5-kinase